MKWKPIILQAMRGNKSTSIGEENAAKNKIPAKYYAKHRIMHFLDHTIFDEINGMWGGRLVQSRVWAEYTFSGAENGSMCFL